MNAKTCIKFLKKPYVHPITGNAVLIDSDEYHRLNIMCTEFIHFDILNQTDILHFNYPKDSPALSFLSTVYFMNLTNNITCQPFKPEFEADLKTSGENAFIRNFDFGFVINKGRLIPPTNFRERLQSCTNRFVLLLVTIIGEGQVTCNLLLHDKKDNEWERFVPFGATQMSEQLSIKVDNLLIGYLEKIGYKVEDYYQPYVGCPIRDSTIKKLNIDEYMKGIYCAVWGIWFVYLKLKNPDIWREHLIYTALEEISEKTADFNKFVRDYLGFLVENEKKITDKLLKLLNTDEEKNRDIDKFLADEIFALLK